jgi:hypothetical protein
MSFTNKRNYEEKCDITILTNRHQIRRYDMFIPMILSFVAGIMLTIFSAKRIKGQGVDFFSISGCILGLAMISIAVYLALPK